MVTPLYQPREPSETILYQVIAEHLETFLATLTADPTAKGLPEYVREEFYAYLQCGILAHGFVRLGCDTCPHQVVLAFSCKKRGFCPSCAGRRMAQQAAHLVEQVIPWVLTRQWVVSVPIPLRYWMAPSRELTARGHTIIRRTIGQYYVNQAVKRGATRATVQPGSVTFLQRFGGSINLNVHVIFLKGVYENRTAQGLKPRFRPQEPPTDAEIAVAMPTGTSSTPLPMPGPDGTTGIKLSPLELLEKLAALVPLPRMHLVRYGGCLAPHSKLRAAIIPTPRQQGVEEPESRRASPNWSWARLLKRVFSIDMERCPVCQQGRLQIIAAIMEASVVKKILRHLRLSVDPPPIAPSCQAAFAWDF